MGEKRAYKPRKPGGGRKKLKPEYDAGKNLKEQMDAAVALYDSEMSLQTIGDALNLNPIKVRKLLITDGVYESEVAEKVQDTFEEYRETQDYKTSILSTAKALNLSKASVTSYLPYQKGVYFPSTEKEKISVGAERQRRYRAMKRWKADSTEENFWSVVLAYAGVKFKTYSGLPFTYEIKKGRNGEYTKELWIDRREKSKSLAWSSVLLALQNTDKETNAALGELIAGNTGFQQEVQNYLVVTADVSAFYDTFERNQVYVEAGLFTMALVEALHYYGIGSCILQNGEYYKKNRKFKDICKNIPENERIILFVAIGYYKDEFSYAVSLRKNVEDVFVVK